LETLDLKAFNLLLSPEEHCQIVLQPCPLFLFKRDQQLAIHKEKNSIKPQRKKNPTAFPFQLESVAVGYGQI
jgi:hypothetical protein